MCPKGRDDDLVFPRRPPAFSKSQDRITRPQAW